MAAEARPGKPPDQGPGDAGRAPAGRSRPGGWIGAVAGAVAHSALLAYVARRLLLIIPTLFGIMVLNFLVVQLVPGGPIDVLLSEYQTDVLGSEPGEIMEDSGYQGAKGIHPDILARIRADFELDKPAHERFFGMMIRYLTFDFGESYFRNRSVLELIGDKMPVSISLGLWTFLFTYLISIPLGILKAVRDGSRFDVVSSGIIVVGYAVPGFLFAIFLIVLFAGGRYLDIFPLRGITSDNWSQLSWWQQVLDYLWHITLPVAALIIGSFATLTMLTKNSFLDELGKQYVTTARAKGLTEERVLYGHVFRNAMLIVIAGFPSAFIGILFTGALLIEIVFSLDGLGLMGYQAIIQRDYPVVFATVYIFSLLGLVMNLITDLTYVAVDPRIDFGSREV